MKKKALWLSGIVIAIVLLFVSNIGFREIFSLPEGFFATSEEVEEASRQGKFGAFVSAKMEKDDLSVSTDKSGEGQIIFKLFGIIPIRKIKVVCSSDEEVYLGGVPIGISLSTAGAIVLSEKMVETEEGPRATFKSEQFHEGDLVTAINGEQLTSLDRLKEIVSNSDSGEFEVSYLRQGKGRKAIIKGEKDALSGSYKLGLWVKDDVSGVGTLTYVTKEGGNFVALGHAITEADNSVTASGGKVFDCKMLGIDKGERNNPGQLRCVFLHNDEPKGEVECNTKYGVYGKLYNLDGVVDQNLSVRLGGRLSVMPGKAYIVSSVSGIREEYEIEIIKASYQSKADDKSMVFRVKDKRLLALTGGIVQGMSGSPIIQNGKLIGAVTHVFLADPTKGYAIYSDWLSAA